METTKLEFAVLKVGISQNISFITADVLYTVVTPTSPCYDGQLQLANTTYSYINGSYFYGGRVEVCYNGTYSPICDDGWTDEDAAVVCYYVGYSYYSKSPTTYICYNYL